MTPAEVEIDLQAHVASLGNTPDAIAASLRTLGIRGVPQDCLACPVARHIQTRWPGGWAGPMNVSDGDAGIRTPMALVMFMSRFDEGAYPDLVSP